MANETVTVTQTTPTVTVSAVAGHTLQAGGDINGSLSLTDLDVAHGITNVAATEAYGNFAPIHGTRGGLYINGLSSFTILVAKRHSLHIGLKYLGGSSY